MQYLKQSQSYRDAQLRKVIKKDYTATYSRRHDVLDEDDQVIEMPRRSLKDILNTLIVCECSEVKNQLNSSLDCVQSYPCILKTDFTLSIMALFIITCLPLMFLLAVSGPLKQFSLSQGFYISVVNAADLSTQQYSYFEASRTLPP